MPTKLDSSAEAIIKACFTTGIGTKSVAAELCKHGTPVSERQIRRYRQSWNSYGSLTLDIIVKRGRSLNSRKLWKMYVYTIFYFYLC